MSDRNYAWKRYWCPREGFLDLSDGGYLREPDSEWSASLSSSLVPFEQLADIPCLILLGEPGIGKSYVMQSEKANLDNAVVAQEGKTLRRDLKIYGTDDRLVRDLFEAPEFTSWLEGKHTLHIFLDSLDECLLRINSVAALLVDELSKYSTKRLYLRIACRTAVWPGSLEGGLKRLWEGDVVKAYKLAPLTRNNVVDAAKENGLSPEDFLREIDRMNAVSLATKPITLDFLIAEYRKHRRLPGTQVELYREGCRRLCEETNPDRRAANLTGVFSADQRMAVAARIAAVTMLCNRNAVWTDIDYGDMPDEDVKVRDLYGGNEFVNAERFQVTEAAIRETLETGLFSARGAYSMGWAHQTYAEFLAAWYLEHRQMTVPQMLSLLMHSGELGRNLVPQLYETAAWLAGMVPDVFQEIMRINPEVLLRSDVAAVDIKTRVALLETILELFDEEVLSDRDWGIRGNYKNLKHPGLAEQLRPYILGDDKGIIVRRVATDIAEACELREVQEDLLRVVLNLNQPYEVRVNAAWALSRIADETTKAKLKPLVFGQIGDDPGDDLKGCALLSMWPQHLSAEELFAVLTHPKRDSYLGAYRSFLGSNFVKHLDPSGLSLALHWTEGLPARYQLSFDFQRIIDDIFWLGWQHLDEANVLDAFVRAIWVRLQYHDIFVSQGYSKLEAGLRENNRKRRLLIEAIYSLFVKNKDNPDPLVFLRPFLILSEDALWMLERFLSTNLEHEQKTWARLIWRVYDEHNVDQQNAIYKACQESPILAQEFALFFGSIELNSPQALQLQKMYEQERKWQQEREDWNKSLGPPVEEWVESLLQRFESGDLNAWWQLTLDIGFTANHASNFYNVLEPDLTKHPAWQSADSKTKTRIVQAARRYVVEYALEEFDWIATNILYYPALAGYKALWLLTQEDPNFVCGIPVDVWKKWVPTIIDSRMSGSAKVHQILVRAAYEVSPDEVLAILMRLIDYNNSDERVDYLYVTQGFSACWDDRFAKTLLRKAKDSSLKPGIVRSLLEDLLEHKVEEARAFAESLICAPLSENKEVQSQTIFAAQALMTFVEDAGWTVVWPYIQRDAEFGRKLFLAVADNPDRHSPTIAQKLNEFQLADLYIWLSEQFPHVEDPNPQGFHAITPRESLATWRTALLSQLEQRGTVEACAAIQHIAQALPELDWMKWVLLDAKNIARRKSWKPPQPEAILAMARDQEVRFVQSGDELLDVLLESLKRLEQKLHGETPASRDIWDATTDKKYKPILENPFSDYVKRHLDEDIKQRGIIPNREVELRWGGGDSPGERTDIHVDAVAIDISGKVQDIITVIIEVKGCWHDELETAMQTQLVERYLRDNHCQHGIYLVGWFNCSQWDGRDYKKRKAPDLSIDEAQAKFDAQAHELSRDGIMVKAFVLNAALR